MSQARRRAPTRRLVVRRRIAALTALAAAAVIVAIVSGGRGGSSARPPGLVRVELEGRTVAHGRPAALRKPGAVASLLASVPAVRTVHRGPATIQMQVERAAAARAAERAARANGGTVEIEQRPVAADVRLPIVQQTLRDDCEATALSMLLADSGKRVDQLTLQSQVAHSPPLDPTVGADGSEVWGDPSKGFVGRADGGGPGGGFGVYQGPIQALARRHGVALRNLTGSRPAAVYAALLHGHPVLAWVALSNGPFATWTSPSGRTVRVNYGEHAVVLTGVGPADVLVNDPLSGTRQTWSKARFEQMWDGLGRRALST
ncbi:MAG TPA: C39 family peptidase [Solirubrobacterales bacterium]|nr:C39 family peptidase [Solirubrobacterales bacterium]